MSTLQELTSEASFNTHISSISPSTLLILFFHTPWAAPCVQMRTVLETLASTYPASDDPNTPPRISFVSINAEELPDISEQYDVTAVPFVVLQKEGVVQESISGSDVVKVRNAIERLAGPGSTSTSSATKQTIPPALSATPRETIVIPDDDVEAQGPNSSAAATAPAQESKESLFARLGELVKAAPIMLFMKGTPSAPECGFSRQMVGILRENGVKYGFFNILADEDVRQGLKEFADWPTYPQLWVSGELVGGLDIVKEEVAANPEFFKDYAVPRAA